MSLSIYIRLDVDGVGLWLIIGVIFHTKSNEVDKLCSFHPRIVSVFILRHISLLLLLLVLFGLSSWLL